MSQVIAIVNQKGGVGKTTTCINLAASLVALEQRVVLIDLDPQGNATTGSGIDKHTVEHDISDVLLGRKNIQEVIYRTAAGYGLVPSNVNLTVAEVELLQRERREFCLKEYLPLIRTTGMYIFLDCPPSLSMLTVNALVAADAVLIPIQCEYFALEGLTNLMSTIEDLKMTVNPSLHITGLLRTMFDTRNSLSKQVSEELLIHFKDKVYETYIPRNIRLAEAPSYGEPVLLYDSTSAGSKAYLSLAKEFLVRQNALKASIMPLVNLLKKHSENLY